MAVIIVSIVKGVWEGRRGGEWEGIQRANKNFPGVTIRQELRKGSFFLEIELWESRRLYRMVKKDI